MRRAYCILPCLLLAGALLFAQAPSERCDDAQVIQFGVYVGETCSASRDGSSSCAPSAGAGDVWYKYTAAADETIAATTFGSNYDSVLSVHTGCPGTQDNQVACSDDCGNQGACVSFAATAGSSYWIRISGFQNFAGRFRLSLGRDGGISGRVTDSSDANPLKDVSVLVYILETLEFVKMMNTNNAGNYVFAGLSPGNYILRTLNNSGYVDELYDNQTCEGVTCDPGVAFPVTVTAGQFHSGIDFALDRGGKIIGTVTDASTGLPIQGVEVHVHDPANNHITLGFTDASGGYSSFDGLAAGGYLVMAFNHARYVDELYAHQPCPGASCTGAGGTLVPVTLGSTATIDFALNPGGLITGAITDAAAQPVSGVQVVVYDGSGKRITTGSSNAAGEYQVFDGLPTGSYRLRTSNSKGFVDELFQDITCVAGLCRINAGTPVPVFLGEESRVDFQLNPGGKISGTVRDAGTGLPLQSVPVDILDAGNHHLRYEFTNAAGQYSTAIGLETGDFFIKTFNQIGYMDEIYDDIPCIASRCSVSQGTPIPLYEGDHIQNVDLDLDPGGTVSGTVSAAATGLPLENVLVYLFDKEGTFATYGYSDSCGKYTTIHGVPDGSYFLRTFNSFGLMDEVYDDVLCPNGSCSLFAGNPVAVEPATRKIDFLLSDQILLRDEFDDGVMDWDTSGGTWTEADGLLSGVSDQRKTDATPPAPWNPSGAQGCSGCTVQVRVQVSSGRAMVRGWYRDKKNYVELQVIPSTGKWKLKQIAGGAVVNSARAARPINPGTFYDVKIVFDGRRFRVSVDGQSILTLTAAGLPSGNVGFRIKDGSASFDRIQVY